jgi:hypothetical protein
MLSVVYVECFMLSVVYVECFMLSVTNKPFILSVVSPLF